MKEMIGQNFLLQQDKTRQDNFITFLNLTKYVFCLAKFKDAKVPNFMQKM